MVSQPDTNQPEGINGKPADYLKAIINSLEDELIVIDRDFRVIQVNEAALNRYGKTSEELLGQNCFMISHGLSHVCRAPYHKCPVKAVLETGKPSRVTHLHTYNIKGEKQERYLDIIASPITDAQGNIIAVAELMRDVTESKRMEMKIAEAHRNLLALNTIASVVSQSLDLDTVLSNALDKTLEIMKVNTGGILLWDEEGQMLCYRVHHGLPKEYVQDVCYLPGEGVAGKVAQTGEAILVEDISLAPHTIHPGLINAEGLMSFACVPLRAKDKVLGVLNIASQEARKFSPQDIQFLSSIAAQIAIAVENAKLHQEVQRNDENRGELLRELFSVQEEERKRIARELHDETAQTLASLVVNLEAVSSLLPSDATEVRNGLKKVQSMSINALDEIHRLIYELRPSLLDDLGLVSATRWLAENNLDTSRVAVNFKTTGRERRLPAQLETTIFRVVQQATANIAKHSGATRADISLHFGKNTVKVTVDDNGKGFDIEEAISSKDRPRGLGLVGMRERWSFSMAPSASTQVTEMAPEYRSKFQ